ncbi:hypothetical protein [Caballeronia sp. GAFFF2]|uniref:hypothetical protein n=1 Tax=Caballeronia sp. GAFFF2 TaxID=2921741 RepID=UPI002028C870|nr:hypothetical protein [Caballeronia sp. GAFFF2]
MGGKRWSDEEKAVLREIYDAEACLSENMHRLPGRTFHSAKSKASKYGMAIANERFWSEEEKAILAKIWRGKQSIKVGLKQLPGRSYDSARAEAQRLGLTYRKKKLGRTGYSHLESVVAAILEEGIPLTIKEMVERTGHSFHGIETVLRRRHGRAFHIAGYQRMSQYGNLTARWMVGKADDAVKPPRKSASQACREWRFRQQLKRHGHNPFSTIAQQVAA